MKIETIQAAPDIFALDEWAIEHRPDIMEAIRYCQQDTRYNCLIRAWRDAGEPELVTGPF